jgi:ankyrin repeat protein
MNIDRGGVLALFNRLKIEDVDDLEPSRLFAAATFFVEGLSPAQLEAKWTLLCAVLERFARLMHVDTPGRIDSSSDFQQVTLMHEACVRGLLPLVRKLIELGSDVLAKQPGGYTLLHVAREPELIRLLINGGLDVDARDQCGLTALHRRAWESTHFSSRRDLGWSELIALGADVNAQTEWLEGPLHIACGSRTKGPISRDVAIGLMRAGADVNARDRLRRTPAMYLAGKLASDTVKDVFLDLKRHGADLDARDACGLCALDVALNDQNPRMVRLLLALGATKLPPRGLGTKCDRALEAPRLHNVIATGNTAIVDDFLAELDLSGHSVDSQALLEATKARRRDPLRNAALTYLLALRSPSC